MSTNIALAVEFLFRSITALIHKEKLALHLPAASAIYVGKVKGKLLSTWIILKSPKFWSENVFFLPYLRKNFGDSLGLF